MQLKFNEMLIPSGGQISPSNSLVLQLKLHGNHYQMTVS